MQMTRKVTTAIKAACEKKCGGRRTVEVGERHWPTMPDTPNVGLNFLLWEENNDLEGTLPLQSLAKADVPDASGWVALDCYCYSQGVDGELDCNVYILLDPQGQVRYASQNDLQHVEDIDAILAEVGLSYSPAE